MVTDQYVSTHTLVIIDVVRDDHAPHFVQLQYHTRILETAAIDSTVYTVFAEDQDNKVRVTMMPLLFIWNDLHFESISIDLYFSWFFNFVAELFLWSLNI